MQVYWEAAFGKLPGPMGTKREERRKDWEISSQRRVYALRPRGLEALGRRDLSLDLQTPEKDAGLLRRNKYMCT